MKIKIPNLTDDQSNKSKILILKLLPVTTKSIYAISFDLLPILLSRADFFESLNCTGTARELQVKRKEKVSLCLKMFVFDQELYMLYMNHSKFGTTTFYSTYKKKPNYILNYVTFIVPHLIHQDITMFALTANSTIR